MTFFLLDFIRPEALNTKKTLENYNILFLYLNVRNLLFRSDRHFFQKNKLLRMFSCLVMLEYVDKEPLIIAM